MAELTSLPLICLAPMAGISDWPFRLLSFELGADAVCTEMISAQGYLSAPKDSYAYLHLMQSAPGEGPLAAQVFGHHPDYIYAAVRRITDTGGFAGIDLNMGCPAPKVCSSGSGAALMRTPDIARAVARAARLATPLPLSVKMRLGWDKNSVNAVPFALMLQDEGVDLITVHGRTRAEQYAGKADWQGIAKVRQALRIPVIANGDVFTPQDALDILRVTGCEGVAVGRGALGNPWLFSQIKQALRGEIPQKPSRETVLTLALRHARLMADWKGERSAVVEMRKHFAWYLKGMHGAASLRRELNQMEELREVRQSLASFMLAPAAD